MENKDSTKEKNNPAEAGIPTGPMAAFNKELAQDWLKEKNVVGIRVLDTEEGELMQRLRRDTNKFKYKASAQIWSTSDSVKSLNTFFVTRSG